MLISPSFKSSVNGLVSVFQIVSKTYFIEKWVYIIQNDNIVSLGELNRRLCHTEHFLWFVLLAVCSVPRYLSSKELMKDWREGQSTSASVKGVC